MTLRSKSEHNIAPNRCECSLFCECGSLLLLLHVVPRHIAAIGLEGRKRSVVVFEECEGGIADLAEIIGDEVHIDVEASHGTADEIDTVALDMGADVIFEGSASLIDSRLALGFGRKPSRNAAWNKSI